MSNYNYSNPSNKMRARKLLQELMPRARQRLQQGKGNLENAALSHIAENMSRVLSVDKLDGIHIYPGPKGGWHADLTLKGMPPGYPTIMGTPKAMPCTSRENAVDQAIWILAAFLQTAADAETSAKEMEAVFEFDSVALNVPVQLIEKMSSATEKPTLSYVRHRLDEIRQELGTDRITREFVERLDEKRKLGLMSVVLMALSVGIFRWPQTEDKGPPSMH